MSVAETFFIILAGLTQEIQLLIVISLQVEHELSQGRQIWGDVPTMMKLLIQLATTMH